MSRVVGLGIVLWLAACSPASFQPHFTTPVAPTESDVLRKLTAQKPRSEQPVMVAVSEDPTKLIAWDLGRGLMWERSIEPRSAPLVAADAVIIQERQGIVVRDLASGDVRAVIDEENAKLVGADGHDGRVIISLAIEGEGPRGAVACVEGKNVRWLRTLSLPVGVPALVDNLVVVPWATQRISVLTYGDGTELARFHFNHTVVGHAIVDRGRMFVGQQGLFPLDADAVARAKQAAAADGPRAYTPFKRSLPGQPSLLRDGYVPIDLPDSAVHRLQASWRPGLGGDAPHAENDQVLLRFYRLMFSLDARQDSVQWVKTFDHDLVGSAIQPGVVIAADAAGSVHAIDASGQIRGLGAVGRALRVATIRPGGWLPPAPAPAGTAAAPAAEPAAAQPTLREQLFAAAALPDSRLSAGRAYAVEQLARLNEPTITRDLIALCDEPSSPEPVQHMACESLAARNDGGEEVVQALRRRASFLEGTQAPPVGALSQVVARMKLRAAAPLLLSQLEDPNTPLSALAAVIGALEQLAHAPAVPVLERFVRMHHAEPDGSDLAPAMNAALKALATFHVRSTRASLQAVIDDGLTPAGTRAQASAALASFDAPAQDAKAAAPEKDKPEPEPAEEVEQTDPRPFSLSPEIVRGAMSGVQKKLSQCVTADETKPRAARVSMVVSGRGEVEGIFVTPTSLSACMEPLLRTAKLPATRSGRQRITYTVKAGNAVAEAPKPRAAGGKKAAGPAKPPASAAK